MTETAAPRTPGWYPNPDDPSTVRWWNGTNFDGAARTPDSLTADKGEPTPEIVTPTANPETAPVELNVLPKSTTGRLVMAYIVSILIPVAGVVIAAYVAVAERCAPVRRHALGIGVAALLASGAYLFIFLSGNAARTDNAVQSDLSSLLLTNGAVIATDVRCSHQSGNQYICFYNANGIQHSALVTDDGHSISEVPY